MKCNQTTSNINDKYPHPGECRSFVAIGAKLREQCLFTSLTSKNSLWMLDETGQGEEEDGDGEEDI